MAGDLGELGQPTLHERLMQMAQLQMGDPPPAWLGTNTCWGDKIRALCAEAAAALTWPILTPEVDRAEAAYEAEFARWVVVRHLDSENCLVVRMTDPENCKIVEAISPPTTAESCKDLMAHRAALRVALEAVSGKKT